MPFSGEHVRQRTHRRGGADRVGDRDLLRSRARRRDLARGPVRRGLGHRRSHRLRQRRQRECHVCHHGQVSHRRARGLFGVARDRHQARALRQQGTGDVGVVGEHRRAHREHLVVWRERFAQRLHRRGEDALEERVVLREAQPPAAGRRGRVHRQAGALGERHRRVPPARRVDVRARHQRRVGRSHQAPRRGPRERSAAVGEARAPPLTVRVVWWRHVVLGARTSAYQSSIGTDTNTGPRGASAAVCTARASACGTSCAQGGS